MSKSKSELRLGFFELLFGVSEGYLCIFSTDPRAPKTAVTQQFFEWPRESIKVENYILDREKSENLYFCVNLLAERQRKKSYCLPTDLVWADLDEAKPDSDKMALPPPIVVESSPGRWQAYWRLTTKLDPYDAERYSRRVAYAMGADTSGWDLTQLMRIPLTRNFKYKNQAIVQLVRILEARAEPALFEQVLPAIPEEIPMVEMPIMEGTKSADEIVSDYRLKLDMNRFIALYSYEPDEDADWSKLMWSMEVMCFSAGMSAEEVFVVMEAASCNKYARDGRPIEHLWREILRCGETYGNVVPDAPLLEMPQLVYEPASETIINDYLKWANEATDAISEFHELSAFIIFSAVVANSLRLETGYGSITPNLWGLVLGDSTVTRKSTAMKMAIDLLTSIDPELLLATDGSVEGLLSGLATRPNKVSVFFRDEISGLFDSINKRDYLASMPETLAHLYDVPPVYSRLLRKEVIRIESPAFVFFGGGITERIYQNVSEDWIESGFMPRFLVVAGDFDKSRIMPTGPPTTKTIKSRAGIVAKLADMFEHYSAEVPTKIGGNTVLMQPRITAHLTPDAWTRYQGIEGQMTAVGYDSVVRNVALPTLDRMSRSILKMGMILAATRQEPVDQKIEVAEGDIINAAYYAQKWGKHSVNLILNSGKAPREKYIQRVYNKIANNPGILRSTLMQHLHMTKREADETMQTLEERGRIRREASNTNGKGSHGARYWVI